MDTQKKTRDNKKNLADPQKADNKGKKQDKKPSGDSAYNAAQQSNDRLGSIRHAGGSEMNDENRSGGAGQ